MRLGVLTSDFSTRPIDAMMSNIASYGFVPIQFAFSSISEADYAPDKDMEVPAEISQDVVKKLKKSIRDNGLDLICINGTFNMASRDPLIRSEGIKRFSRLAEVADELECPAISLCTGSRSNKWMWSYDPANSDISAWNDMMDTAKQLIDVVAPRGIKLLVETEPSNVVDSPEKARKMIDVLGSDTIQMILDGANLFPAGTAHPENVRPTLDRAFKAFGDRIMIAHGKDVIESDEVKFCATGLGIVDFDYMLQGLSKYAPGCDMLLHGIYSDEDMPRAYSFMKDKMSKFA